MSSAKRGDEWQPAFPGQRPPFAPGNQLAARHGAYSPVVVEPVAAALLAEVFADPALGYLDQPAYAPVVRSWATAQARCELFGTWLFEQPIEQQIVPARNGTKAPLDVWLSMVRTATALADRIGLTPLSRAKLGRDVTAAQVQAGIAHLQQTGADLVAKARADGHLDDQETAQ